MFGILKASSSQHFWMITSYLDGGIFFAYFQNGGKRVKSKQKVAYLSKYCFDVDDVDIKVYIFCDAEAMCEVIGEVRGHAHVVAVKDKVMLTE